MIQRKGKSVHRELELRRLFSRETEDFLDWVDSEAPLYFDYQGTRIFIHPDSFWVHNGIVEIIEWKSVQSKPDNFQIVPAINQLKVYQFVLSKILPSNLRLANKHRIMFWRRPSKRIPKLMLKKVVWVYYDEHSCREFIDGIFKIWHGKAKPIPPVDWKCKQCDPILRMNCRFYTGEIFLDWFSWAKRFIPRKLKGKFLGAVYRIPILEWKEVF